MFIAALFTIGTIWKQPKYPLTNECIHICTYVWWNSTQPLKKNEILPSVTTWMELEGIMWSEISQMEKTKYTVWSYSYLEYKNRTTQNELKNKNQTKKTQKNTENRVVITRWEEAWAKWVEEVNWKLVGKKTKKQSVPNASPKGLRLLF